MDKSYVLAMYDIRGKQEFIYRSIKLKEIVGGSAIIRDLFIDYFFPAAKEYRNEQHPECSDQEAVYQYKEALDDDKADVEEFSFNQFEERMNGKQYVGEVIYCGGGNFLVLFKNEEICREITYRFSREVIKHTSTLRVVCTFIDNLDPDCYHSDDPAAPGDYERLYRNHRFNENQETAADPYGTLPVVEADYRTSQPLVCIYNTLGNEEKLSAEQYLKYKKYEAERKQNKSVLGEDQLDKMVKKKGEDSLLAVVYIDGNAMGARVQKCISNKTYDASITELRKFSKEIQKVCIDDRLAELPAENRRVVVYAGDEITIICNAHDAFSVACRYLQNLPEGYSSCAGISIFHSHTPFADAYRIAEECCESGKKAMKKKEITDVSLLDFHYCQGAIGENLEGIRKLEHHEAMSLPWLISSKKGNGLNGQFVTLKEVKEIRTKLDIFGRSNVKGLLEPAQNSEAAFMMEIRRIISHLGKEELEKLKGESDEIDYGFYSRNRLLIRDLVIAYDLGFGKE